MVEELDRYLGDLFSALRPLSPEERFKVSIPLLRLDQRFVTLGFNADVVLREIESVLADRALQSVDAVKISIDRVHRRLTGLDLSYLSTSYWSPAVQHRQSAIACQYQAVSWPLKRRYAIAFFAITAAAADENRKATDRQWSLVHYLAKVAPRKRAVHTEFDTLDPTHPEPDESAVGVVISIEDDPRWGPSYLQSLVRLIERFAGDDLPMGGSRDEDLLQECLLTGAPRHIPDWLARILAEYDAEFAGGFNQWVEAQNGLEALAKLRGMGAKFDDADLHPKRVGFMLAMQVVWRRAFGGNHLYAFPTRVSEECCVLTAGARARLPEAGSHSRQLLVAFGRSLFDNQLFADYGAAAQTAERRAYESFVAHNLPKLVIAPASAELGRIEKALSEGGLESARSASLRKELDSLQALYGHYESLLGRFRLLDRRNESVGMPTRPENVDFDRDVRAKLKSVFRVMRDRVLDPCLRKNLELRLNDTQELKFVCDPDMLTEILINLLNNAVDSIDPRSLEPDAWRANIAIHVSCTAAESPRFTQFLIRDHGAGIPPKKLAELRDMARSFATATQLEWQELVERFMNAQALRRRSLERFGVGLPLSMAYLRQLQWDEHYQAAGSIEINSGPEELDGQPGTAIVIKLPEGTLDRPPPSRDPRAIVGTEPPREVITGILSTDQDLIKVWRQHLPKCRVCRSPREAADCDNVIIDALYLTEARQISQLSRSSARDLMASFAEPARMAELPKSVLALMILSDLGAERQRPDTIVFVGEHLEPALLQQLMRAGADWICTSRSHPERLDEIRRSLQRVRRRTRRPPPEAVAGSLEARNRSAVVLVVENNRSVCLSLRKRLDDIVELRFVGAELAGNQFHITASMAVNAYLQLSRSRHVVAVISDLALDEEAEAQGIAEAQPWTSKAERRKLTRQPKLLDQEDNRGIGATLQAMAEIEQLALEGGDSSLAFFFFSDFVRYPEVTRKIYEKLPKAPVVAMPKNQRGYADLEDLVQRLVGAEGRP